MRPNHARISLFILASVFCVPNALAQAPGRGEAGPRPWTIRDRLAGASFDRIEEAPPVREGRHVVRSEAEWKKVLLRNAGPRSEGDQLPQVEWDRYMVLAVGMGMRPTGGYDVRITDVRTTRDNLVVSVEETRPAPGDITTQALTFPSDTVLVPRTDLKVRWQEKVPRVVDGQTPGRYTGARLQRPSRVRGLANSVFVLRESGGIAGWDRQTVAHLAGRPVSAKDIGTARESRNVELTANRLRRIEEVARQNKFQSLDAVYGRPGAVPDGTTRTIRAFLDGRWKQVTVHDGSTDRIPEAFESVWRAVTEATAAGK